jgi:hypothetical protein
MNYDNYRYMSVPQGQTVNPQATGYSNPPPSGSPFSGWFDFSSSNYLKGMLIAAGVTLLAVNPTVQKTVLKGLAKAWSGLQYGVEEVKEQIHDIKAEMQYKQEQKATAKEESDDA